MIPQEQLSQFTKKIMSQLGFSDDSKNGDKSKNGNNIKKRCLNLTPAEIMVISGIFADVLSVKSLTVDREQQIQIVLGGSLKRKTELEKTLDEIGQKPFDEVLSALLGRYKYKHKKRFFTTFRMTDCHPECNEGSFFIVLVILSLLLLRDICLLMLYRP